MKNYNLIPQEKNNYCLCSVIQAIFDKHGKKISQDQIAPQLNSGENGFYFDDFKFKNFLNAYGFVYSLFKYDTTPFNEPDFLLSENFEKDIFIAWNKHVVLLNDFKDPYIEYINPDKGIVQKKELSSLLFEMSQNKSGFFGVISKGII
ncbi:MAG: cysteine peptidase family C39 domain-containing protein [Candidatus Pacearchaeota archaeon]|jgi:ABC-type bacteriocin/lantibiotic exporter with double-glycine peptidase domain